MREESGSSIVLATAFTPSASLAAIDDLMADFGDAGIGKNGKKLALSLKAMLDCEKVRESRVFVLDLAAASKVWV